MSVQCEDQQFAPVKWRMESEDFDMTAEFCSGWLEIAHFGRIPPSRWSPGTAAAAGRLVSIIVSGEEAPSRTG